MQLSHEKRRLQRQASGDGSSSASETLHRIPPTAHKLGSHTYRCCKSSVATRRLCNRATHQHCAHQYNLEIKKHAAPHYYALNTKQPEINHGDKSQEFPGWYHSVTPLRMNTLILFLGGLTCQHICSDLSSRNHQQKF